MARLGIKEAFARYGAKLRNVQWSVSAWTEDGTLVVSMWEHHRRKGTSPRTLIFEGSFNRWTGPGNIEFRKNIARAYELDVSVRLVIVRVSPEDVARIEAGEDASKIKKDFYLKEEVVGKVTEWDQDHYAVTFAKANAAE